MENFIRNEQETVDNLHIEGYKIIQNKDYFRYGMDAVLLSWFASKRIARNNKIIDLGTGTGILPILLFLQSKNKHIDALEIQDYFVDIAKRNVILNNMNEFVNIIHGDIRELPNEIKLGSYDVVVSNPPYMAIEDGMKNKNKIKAIARHELKCNICDLVVASSKLLKEKGKLIFVHKCERLVDIFFNMRKYNIEPKCINYVYPKKYKEPNLVLIEGIKNAKPCLKINNPIIIYNNNGEYTNQLKEIYGYIE
ncbi:MAG: tRNA1(Val) (adenine(37)-N6)-methyltransferase [Eubacteriaceae bacterium]